jgi:hypothetical protein
MTWPWESGTDAEFCAGMKRRADDIGERAFRRHRIGGDWRPILADMRRLVLDATSRLEARARTITELELQRSATDARHKLEVDLNVRTIREQREIIRLAEEKFESLKRDNATMWTELLRFRNAATPPQDIAQASNGRNYFED